MSHETDQAFLDDYAWMLSTGESHETAATRFGVSANTLQRRLERVRQRVRQTTISPDFSGKIGDGAEGSNLLDAYPLTELAESRTA